MLVGDVGDVGAVGAVGAAGDVAVAVALGGGSGGVPDSHMLMVRAHALTLFVYTLDAISCPSSAEHLLLTFDGCPRVDGLARVLTRLPLPTCRALVDNWRPPRWRCGSRRVGLRVAEYFCHRSEQRGGARPGTPSQHAALTQNAQAGMLIWGFGRSAQVASDEVVQAYLRWKTVVPAVETPALSLADFVSRAAIPTSLPFQVLAARVASQFLRERPSRLAACPCTPTGIPCRTSF